MKICEDCKKKDVCKFKDEVERYEAKGHELPEPLMPIVACKHKETERGLCPYTYYYPYVYPYYGTVSISSVLPDSFTSDTSGTTTSDYRDSIIYPSIDDYVASN